MERGGSKLISLRSRRGGTHALAAHVKTVLAPFAGRVEHAARYAFEGRRHHPGVNRALAIEPVRVVNNAVLLGALPKVDALVAEAGVVGAVGQVEVHLFAAAAVRGLWCGNL